MSEDLTVEDVQEYVNENSYMQEHAAQFALLKPGHVAKWPAQDVPQSLLDRQARPTRKKPVTYIPPEVYVDVKIPLLSAAADLIRAEERRLFSMGEAGKKALVSSRGWHLKEQAVGFLAMNAFSITWVPK